MAIDSSSVRVRQEGMRYIKNSKIEQEIEKSRGGFTTKIHTTVDRNGIPISILLSCENIHDVKFGDKLIENLNYKTVLADRGYDSDDFEKMITNPCIPRRKNMKIEIV